MGNSLVQGVGINDAGYAVCPIVDGKRVWCSFYRAWTNMLMRCYNKKYQERKPTYIVCSVYEEWLTFSNFKKWMIEQEWQGKQLDKDVLDFENKQYNPASCVFIFSSLNSLLTDCAIKRGAYPLGVCWKKENSKFQSQVTVSGKRKHLGYFTSPQAAHQAWQLAKKQIIHDVAMEQTDARIRNALLLRCQQLQDDLDNNRITIKL